MEDIYLWVAIQKICGYIEIYIKINRWRYKEDRYRDNASCLAQYSSTQIKIQNKERQMNKQIHVTYIKDRNMNKYTYRKYNDKCIDRYMIEDEIDK